MMYGILGPHLDKSGIPRSVLRKQLESEFGTRVEDVKMDDVTSAPPTQEEIQFVERGIKAQIQAYMRANRPF